MSVDHAAIGEGDPFKANPTDANFVEAYNSMKVETMPVSAGFRVNDFMIADAIGETKAREFLDACVAVCVSGNGYGYSSANPA